MDGSKGPCSSNEASLMYLRQLRKEKQAPVNPQSRVLWHSCVGDGRWAEESWEELGFTFYICLLCVLSRKAPRGCAIKIMMSKNFWHV